MLKRSLYKSELEPNWPSPDKVTFKFPRTLSCHPIFKNNSIILSSVLTSKYRMSPNFMSPECKIYLYATVVGLGHVDEIRCHQERKVSKGQMLLIPINCDHAILHNN